MMKKILALTIVLVLGTFGLTNACSPDASLYEGQQFGDVWPYHWYYNDVNELAKAGLINGKPQYCRAWGRTVIHFDAEASITVQEFWAILSRILAEKFSEKNEMERIDKSSLYLYEPMRAADYNWSREGYYRLALYLEAMDKSKEHSGEYSIKKGLIDMTLFGNSLLDAFFEKKTAIGESGVTLFLNGSTAKMVTPNDNMVKYRQDITREQAAAILGFFVADNQMTSVNTLGAKDWLETRRTSGVDTLYRKYINELIERGLFKGVENNGEMYVYPKKNLTRGEAAALLNRFYKNLHLVD